MTGSVGTVSGEKYVQAEDTAVQAEAGAGLETSQSSTGWGMGEARESTVSGDTGRYGGPSGPPSPE